MTSILPRILILKIDFEKLAHKQLHYKFRSNLVLCIIDIKKHAIGHDLKEILTFFFKIINVLS